MLLSVDTEVAEIVHVQKRAEDIRWYIEKCMNDGILRHLVDSQEWKEFDLKHHEFA